MEQEQSREQEFEHISDNEYERTAGNDHEQDTEHPYESGPARCDTMTDVPPLCGNHPGCQYETGDPQRH